MLKKTPIIIILVILTGSFLFAEEAGKETPTKTGEEQNKRIGDTGDKIDELNEKIEALTASLEKISALRISGFFDVSISNYKNKPNVFSLGDFELDIEHNYPERFQVAAALVFNKGANLDVGFIDYRLFGSPVSVRGRLFADEGLHLQVGRFDVPFGNDWQHFPSKDRITVTPPLTTEMTMEGGYNDEGARLLFNSVWCNITLYVLDGIEQKYSYGGNSYGGRIGLTPFSNPYRLKARAIPVFETGFSYIYDIDSDGKKSESLYAFDIESKISFFFLQSEYINREKRAGIIFDGYHVTCGIDFSAFSSVPLLLYGRYDYFRMKNYVPDTFVETAEPVRDNVLTRISAGMNINIYKISFLKLEYQRYLETYEEYRDQYYSESLYYAQLVITF